MRLGRRSRADGRHQCESLAHLRPTLLCRIDCGGGSSPLLFEAVVSWALRLPLGPLIYLATAFPGVERRTAIPAYPVVYMQAIYAYVFWTVLLMLCLAITLRKTEDARVIGFSLAALIWIASAVLAAAFME